MTTRDWLLSVSTFVFGWACGKFGDTIVELVNRYLMYYPY